MQLELELQDFHIIKIAHIKAAGISQSMMELIIHERFEALLKERLNYNCPTIIEIDEHTIHKSYKFATTVADLRHHRICDVIKGKRHGDI